MLLECGPQGVTRGSSPNTKVLCNINTGIQLHNQETDFCRWSYEGKYCELNEFIIQEIRLLKLLFQAPVLL